MSLFNINGRVIILPAIVYLQQVFFINVIVFSVGSVNQWLSTATLDTQYDKEARKDKHLLSTDRFRCPERWQPAARCKRWTWTSCRCYSWWATSAPTGTTGCCAASSRGPPPGRLPSSVWFPVTKIDYKKNFYKPKLFPTALFQYSVIQSSHIEYIKNILL